MKKRIVGMTAALVLVTGIYAASVAGATTKTPDAKHAPVGITSLNHAVVTNNAKSAMQIAIDNMNARAAAEEAARQAEAAAQAAAAAATVSNNSTGGSGNGGSAAQAEEAAPAEEGDIWGILASFGVDNVSIAYGDAQGYQAISYYKSGYIVINPNHSASLYTLIAHEVEHIVAYRQSGKTTE